jgi:ribosome-binding factor A
MPREYSRARRVEDQVQRLLVDLIRREVRDPRVGAVTITAVQVSPDLSHAKVFFTPFAGGGDAEEVRAALGHAAGFLRRELKRELGMRQVPELHFEIDETIERGARLSQLIDQAVATDRARHVDDEES